MLTLIGVVYYNDSKATNVDASLKAIEAFPGHLWIILGGKDKGSDYRPLREPLHRKAKAALLIGKAAEKIESELNGAVPLAACGTMAEAVGHARARAESWERSGAAQREPEALAHVRHRRTGGATFWCG